MDNTSFYRWEKKINTDFSDLFTTDTPSKKTGVAQDSLPEEMDWIALLARLANDDITKYPAIYETNYIECLTLLSYWKFRDEQNNKAHRAAQKKNK